MDNYIIAAFRSRTHTLQFNDILTRNRIQSFTLNTPKEAGVGCGLSLKFLEFDLPYVKRLLKKYNFGSFAGFFSVTKQYGRVMIRAI